MVELGVAVSICGLFTTVACARKTLLEGKRVLTSLLSCIVCGGVC